MRRKAPLPVGFLGWDMHVSLNCSDLWWMLGPVPEALDRSPGKLKKP